MCKQLVFPILRVLILGILLALGAPTAALPAQAAPTIPVERLLNPDGTLNTSTGVSGALDVRGWNVTLDAERGPVLQPADNPSAKPKASMWSPLSTGMDAAVNALAISGTDVYAGGQFTSAGSCTSGNGCNYIAKWNGSAWSPLGTGMNWYVFALAISGTNVYAGGAFTRAGSCTSGNGCNYIAKWDGSTWSQLDAGTTNQVYALAVGGTDLYAGGWFLGAGTCTIGNGCNHIAKWNGSAWSPLGTGTNDNVYSLAVSGTNVYAGGVFTSAGSCTSGCSDIAKWNGSTWSPLGTGMNSTVWALAVSGTNVYAGGAFTSAGSCASGCNRIAKWDGSAWSALGTGMNNTVYALAAGSTNVYAGGAFTSAGSCTSGCNYIAKWNGGAWSPLETGMNDNVDALAISGANVYAGGPFTSAGSCTSGCNRIATYADYSLVYADPVGTCGGNTPCYTSLQTAINTVDADGEVRYYGGTYNEAVSLNKGATLNFVGSSNVTINGALSISAGTFNAPGAYSLSLKGDLTNSGGTFNANGGTFAFAGSGTQIVSGDFTFNNLTVNSGAIVDVGSNTLTVLGTTTNAGTIKRLTPPQYISGGNNDFTFNDAISQPTVIISLPGEQWMGNTTVQVTANPTSTAFACGSITLGGKPVKRSFTITPDNGNVTANVTLFFFDDGTSNSEANGNDLSNIAFYHCEGGTWQRLSGSYTTGTSGDYKWVKLSGYPFSSFSPFAIGGGPGAPTAVTLSSFRASAPTFDLAAWFAEILRRWWR